MPCVQPSFWNVSMDPADPESVKAMERFRYKSDGYSGLSFLGGLLCFAATETAPKRAQTATLVVSGVALLIISALWHKCYLQANVLLESLESSKQKKQPPQQPKPIVLTEKKRTIEQQVTSMRKNMDKAILEHIKANPTGPWMQINEAISPVERLQKAEPKETPLTLKITSHSETGCNKLNNEDWHFSLRANGFTIFGVFDGHAGDRVAKVANAFFVTYYENLLITSYTAFDVGCIFDTCFETANEKIRENKLEGGSTAVVCVVDEKTHLVYTATLGDSEANIYRKNSEGVTKSIPLSCVRNWASPKDAKRASIALKTPSIATCWPTQHSKTLRFPGITTGLNISRALGDLKYTPAVTHKPKYTVNRLKAGDTLVLTSDGLKDFVTEAEIVASLERCTPENNLAEHLVKEAQQSKSEDDITVIAAKIT